MEQVAPAEERRARLSCQLESVLLFYGGRMTTCTVPIVGGPNLHLIERNLMVPRIELAYSDPVEFKIVLPFESKLLSYQPTEASRVVYVRLALTAMKRLDDSLLMLEGWDACKKFFNPLMEPPFTI